MSARIYGGIPLTLMMAVTLLHAGAAAGWWPAEAPLATLLATGVTWACGLWLFWQIDTTRKLPAIPIQPAERATPRPAAAPVRIEQRRTTRFSIRCPVELDLPEHGHQRGELRDISQGGARVAGISPLEPDSYGAMRLPGISLAVPFCVVGMTPDGEVRVRFELSGISLDTFLRQFDRLIAAGTPAITVS